MLSTQSASGRLAPHHSTSVPHRATCHARCLFVQPHLQLQQLRLQHSPATTALAATTAAAGPNNNKATGCLLSRKLAPTPACAVQRQQRRPQRWRQRVQAREQQQQQQQQNGGDGEGVAEVEKRFKHMTKRSNGTYLVQLGSRGEGGTTRTLLLGHYRSQSDAARVADAARVGLGKPPSNFPDADYGAHPLALRLRREAARGASFDELQAAAREVLGLRAYDKQGSRSTEFLGVQKGTGPGSFEAYCKLRNTKYILSAYPSAEHAAYLYDRVAVRLWGDDTRVNFPEVLRGERTPPCELQPGLEAVLGDEALQGERLVRAVRDASRAIYKSGTSSEYAGVCWVQREEAWVVQLSAQRKLHRLGLFPPHQEEAAARMRDRGVLYRRHLGLARKRGHFDALNFPEEDYDGDALLHDAMADGVGMDGFARRCRDVARSMRGEQDAGRT